MTDKMSNDVINEPEQEIAFLIGLYLYCFIVSIIIFACFFIYAFIIFRNMKSRPERVTIVTATMYGLSITIRLGNWTLYMSQQIVSYIYKVELLVVIASQIVWIILYYFTFELKSFKDKVESETADDFFKKQKKNKILKIIGLSVIAAC